MCWLDPLPPWGASYLPSSPKAIGAPCPAGAAAPLSSPRAFIVMVNRQLEYQVSSHLSANPPSLGKFPGSRQCQSSRLQGSLSQDVKAADSRNSQQQGIMLLTACDFGVTPAIWDTRVVCCEPRSSSAFGLMLTLFLHPLGFVLSFRLTFL